jgi:hypothetical protein
MDAVIERERERERRMNFNGDILLPASQPT